MTKLLAILAAAAVLGGSAAAFAADAPAPVSGATPMTTAEMDDARGAAGFGNSVTIPAGTTIRGGAYSIVFNGTEWKRVKN